MLPCPVILALQPRPRTGRLLLALRHEGRPSPFLSPTRNPPWPARATTHNPPRPTRPSSTLTTLRARPSLPYSISTSFPREAQPSLPHSIPPPFLPRRLVSPLLATRHSSLATSSHLTLLKSHCSTKITRNPQRITLFHKHQGVPQSFFPPRNHQIPIRHITHKPNKKGHLCPTTPIANRSASTTPPPAAAAACSNLQITRPSALSTRPPKPNS